MDAHAHILPCADHGSQSVEMSLRQLSRARAAGVTDIIATPHFYPHRHRLESFLPRRENALRALLPALDGDMPRIHLGAEVLLCDGLERMDRLEALCVQGTRTLLLEMPFSGMGEALLGSMYDIQAKRGLRVLLAHIDRYPRETVLAALETGASAQLNAEGICSLKRGRRCREWLREGVVQAIGSDVHGDGTQYRAFARAIHKPYLDCGSLMACGAGLLLCAPEEQLAVFSGPGARE